jgi:long-subunit fatty acid transport protein
VWSATAGGSVRLSPAWRLNGGIFYIPAVYPESTFSPAVPDMDKAGVSIGATHHHGVWSVDAVYNPLFYRTTTIHNTVGQDATGLASADISGQYKAIVHIVGLTVSRSFGESHEESSPAAPPLSAPR